MLYRQRTISRLDIWCAANLPLRHLRLNFAGAVQRIDGAGKFGQEAVAGGLDHSAVMGLNARIDQLNADRPEPSESPLLVAADKPRVARHFGDDPRRGAVNISSGLRRLASSR